MGRIVKVNWAKLHEVGNEFLEQADETNQLVKELEEIFETLDNGWRGIDADVYKNKSTKVIKTLNNETKYLASWHSFLTKTSNRYVNNVENGVSGINSVNYLFDEEDQNAGM